MKSAVKSLQNNENIIAEEVTELHKIIAHKDQKIEQLLDYIQLLRQKQFGRSTERFNKNQTNLFDEAELDALLAELEALSDTKDEPPAEVPASNKAVSAKKKPVRRPLPENLKRIEKVIDLPEAEKQAMGDDWVLIGYEESEQLAVIPRQHYVIKTKRAKYAPANEDVPDAEQGIRVAPRPEQIIPKSIGHSSVIADVVTAKFVDGLPFYRQEKIYERDGISLSRQTMSGWVVQLEDKFTPLMPAIKQSLYDGKVLHIDETRLQVLNEPGKENTQQSYMWVYRGGLPDKPVIWYQYADNRRSQVPVDFLYPDLESMGNTAPPWSLTIMTDGYSGYNALSKMSGIVGHAACWAHARRKFVEASKGRKNTAAAHQIVALIGKLYLIERNIKDKTPDERKTTRLKHALL